METDEHPTGDTAIADICWRVNELLRELEENSYQFEKAELASWCLSKSGIGEEVLKNLDELLSQLRRQFALEEFGHWLEDDLSNSPHYLDALKALYAEHNGLLEQLGDLVKLTKSTPQSVFTWLIVDSELPRFAARLTDHERREADLIQRIMCTEVGVID